MKAKTEIELEGGSRAKILTVETKDGTSGRQLTSITLTQREGRVGNADTSITAYLGDDERTALIKALSAIK